MKKLKILAAGDIHGDVLLAKRLAEKAKRDNVDLVILCGDLTLFDKNYRGIMGEFLNRDLKVLFVPGNHDSPTTSDLLSEIYNIKNLHDNFAIYGDVAFLGVGWANIGPYYIEEDELFKIIERNFVKINNYNIRKKVLVSHVHPSGTLIERFTSFFKGSEKLRDAIEKFNPDIVLCSHVHEAEGIEEIINNTRIINVGRHGKIIEIN